MFVTTLTGHHTHSHTHPSHICTQCVITKGSVVCGNVHKTPTFTHTQSHTHNTYQSHTATLVTCCSVPFPTVTTIVTLLLRYTQTHTHTCTHSLAHKLRTQATCTPGHRVFRVYLHTYIHTLYTTYIHKQ